MNDNNTTSKSIILLAMLLGLLAGIAFCGRKDRTGHIGNTGSRGESTLEAVYDLVRKEYVDIVDRDSVDERMINSMLSSLDPHSRYLAPKELERQQEEMRGGFDGIGLILRYRNDTVWAGTVMDGSPAQRAGVHAGDRVIAVNGDTVSGVNMSGEEVVKRIRGRKGTRVTMSLLRGADSRPVKVSIRRDAIATPSIPYSGMLDRHTGYIKLIRFGETTYREFHTALAQLKAEGMERLILDLRGNGGGLLDAAINIANDLLPNGNLIVYTEGANQRRNDTRSRGRAFYEGDVIVMIDELSASASEVVSGAIQDNDRGTIVGRRSFGKGLVQRQFDLENGGALWLTVARYYTPSGRCIQRPYDKGTDEYYESYLEQMLEDMDNDSIVSAITDTTKYYTKKGRVVYGGGGIFPDKVLSYLKDSNLVYINALINRRFVSDIVLDYVKCNYDMLTKEYPREDDFVKKFIVNNDLVNELYAYAGKNGLKKNERSAKKYNNLIRTTLKANIGECLYGTAAFYRIYAPCDYELSQVTGNNK